MIYLYNADGFFLKSLDKANKTNYPNSTEQQPDFTKLNSSQWEVKFSVSENKWVYTDLTPKPDTEFDQTIPPTSPELDPLIREAQANELKSYIPDILPSLVDELLSSGVLLNKLKAALNAN